MGWVFCGVVITAKTVAVACGAAAAIGLVAYGIYKYSVSLNKPLTYAESKKNENDTLDFVEIKDIKPETQGTELRRRNVTKEDIENERNENQSVTKEDIQKKDTSDEPNKKIESSHREVQTVSEQGTFDLHGRNLLPNGNRALNDDIVSVCSSTTFDGTESTCDSLASTETVTSDTDLDLLAGSIPTWDEMSDVDRKLCLCPGCEWEDVSTITISCEHPYLCNECAPIVAKFYTKCRLCLKHISGFQSIKDV